MGLDQSEPAKVKHAIRDLGKTLGGADALFTAGTYAIIKDYKMQQAKTLGFTGAEAESWAENEAERLVEQVAQPVRNTQRSIMEHMWLTNPSGRMVWASLLKPDRRSHSLLGLR